MNQKKSRYQITGVLVMLASVSTFDGLSGSYICEDPKPCYELVVWEPLLLCSKNAFFFCPVLHIVCFLIATSFIILSTIVCHNEIKKKTQWCLHYVEPALETLRVIIYKITHATSLKFSVKFRTCQRLLNWEFKGMLCIVV